LEVLAAEAASDPSARAFVEGVKAKVADGSIWKELAEQPDVRTLIEDSGRSRTDRPWTEL
jgi:hypothetical protein